MNAGFTRLMLVTGHLHHTASRPGFSPFLSAMLFHSAVEATAVNQATLLRVVEQGYSSQSGYADTEENNMNVHKKLPTTKTKKQNNTLAILRFQLPFLQIIDK